MANVSTWERIERRKLHQRERWKRPARPGDRPDPSRPAGTDTLPQIKHIVILIGGVHRRCDVDAIMTGFRLSRVVMAHGGMPVASRPGGRASSPSR